MERLGQAWWHVPVIPATQEAESGGSIEAGRQRLQSAEIAPLHSSLGDRGNPVSKKKKRKFYNLNNEFKKQMSPCPNC